MASPLSGDSSNYESSIKGSYYYIYRKKVQSVEIILNLCLGMFKTIPISLFREPVLASEASQQAVFAEKSMSGSA